MPEQGMTPEEKLLRLIESPAENVKKMRPVFRRWPDVRLVLSRLKSQYGEMFKNFLTLKIANIVLVVAATAATLYLMLDFWIGAPTVHTIRRLEAAAKRMDVGNMAIERMNPLAVYLQDITQRNVFSLPEAPSSPKPAEQAPKSSEARSLLSSLRVVGILWSEAPQAIVEDTKEGKTYFLNRGSPLREARVKDILKDRVILSYDNQEIEIR